MPYPTLTLRADIAQPLNELQFDDNNRRHEQRIDDILDDPPAVVPTNLTQAETVVTLHFSNATSYPFTVPTIRMNWRGEWIAATVYLENDIVVVTGDGVYLVLENHTSDATFDPAEANTNGPFYVRMIGAGADGATGPEGPQGEIGPSGGRWFTGMGPPDPGLGDDGDFYLNQGAGTDEIGSGDIYEHQGTDSWVLVENISGPEGDIGPAGPTGPEGPQGATGAGSTIIVEEGGVPTSSPVSNLNFDDGDFDVTEDTTGLVTVSLSGAAGKLAQVVNTQTGAVATGTTQMVLDDTIPQNTEGDEYMTLAITPTNASSTLYIDVTIILSNSTASRWIIAALFQDSTASALAAGYVHHATATESEPINFRHKMTAGTTSPTTFKVRGGAHSTGTTTFNGHAGARALGGALASSITITEVLP